ncbi:MAG: hypothetical protein ACHQVK_02770 [Candidatus Paceibacterales bacterium]
MTTGEQMEEEDKIQKNKAEWLRSLIPPEGKEGPEAKKLSPMEKLVLEKRMDEERHPKREPERPAASSFPSTGVEIHPQTESKIRKRISIATEELEE